MKWIYWHLSLFENLPFFIDSLHFVLLIYGVNQQLIFFFALFYDYLNANEFISIFSLFRIFFSALGWVWECARGTWRPKSFHPEGNGQNKKSKEMLMFIFYKKSLFWKNFSWKSYVFLMYHKSIHLFLSLIIYFSWY